MNHWDFLQQETTKEYLNSEVRKLLDECGGEDRLIYSANYHEEQDTKPSAKQVGGSHYQVAAIQPWDIMAAYGLDPWSANVVKYILRFPYKAGRQDLEKAQHYIEYLITHYDEVKDKYYD
jgi:hypothetical protein